MAANDVKGNIVLSTLGACLFAMLGLVLRAGPTPQAASEGKLPHRRIMIAGVAHLVAKNDLHNSSFDEPFGASSSARGT